MDPWLNEYERLTQQASEISANIKEVHAQARGGAVTSHAKLSAMVRRKLVQLTTDIASLQDSLPRLQITEKERQRRKDMLFNLSTRKDQLSDFMSKSSASTIGESVNSPDLGKKRTWGAQQQPQETEETKDLDNAQLLQHQKSRMKDQDDHIDILSSSIVRQKEIAVTIHSELDVHSRLLDDLDSKVGKTTSGIERENRHLSKVSESAKVGGMWICIVFLIIIIIVLAATDWGCKIYYDKDRCS